MEGFIIHPPMDVVCLGSHGHTQIPRNYSADLLAELARLVAPDGSRAPIPNLDWSGKIEHPCGHSILHLWGDLVGYIDCIALYALIAITGQQSPKVDFLWQWS